ncbi:MAG: hypothetical protein MR828_10085, partial [Clostridiales bacterium]|nr:hypothetical protein [Clostridiales bacterium]
REAASLPYSFIVVLREFAQPGSSFLACTARAANSRPYGDVIDKLQFITLLDQAGRNKTFFIPATKNG